MSDWTASCVCQVARNSCELAILSLVVVVAACSERSNSAGSPNLANPIADSQNPPSSDALKTPSSIPIHVTPYYDSEGPEINVGEFSTRLSTESAAKLRDTVTEMEKQWDELSVEAMYVASIRLYELGLKDESVYWFYSAQYRARLYQSVLDTQRARSIGTGSFERCQAQNAFHALAGENINGYAFKNFHNLLATIDEVRDEGKSIPNLESIYPKDVFVPRKQWQTKNDEISRGLASFADEIRENKAEISATRQRIQESTDRLREHLRDRGRLVD